jgi:adenylate cyclase
MSSWTSDRPGGFDDDDVAAIEILLPVLALAIKAETTAGIAHSVVETYLGRDAGHRVLSGEIGRGSVETIRAVLWLCDLQGFTKIADSTPRDELIPMLNDYFEAMVDTVHEHGGQVLKFMGDGLLAILNLDDGEDDQVCAGALDAAEEALARVDEVNQRRADEGLPVTEFSLALHLGEVLYGNVGSRDRLDFTVVGPAVNEVSRIEAMCRSLDQNLIISSTFAHAAMGCSERLISLGRYALRGVRRPQELYTLLSREDAEEADILEAGSLAAS